MSSTLRQPKLTFAPLAWLKLQFFCHRSDTEIGGFGITALGNPLYVEDFVTVRQDTSPVTVSFRDDSVADYFDRCVDRKLSPERFARIWLHTHPGSSVTPSATDESTFASVFGQCDWALMAILGRTGKTYARLSYRIGPKMSVEIPTTVDWTQWPAHWIEGPSLDEQTSRWAKEYATNINAAPSITEQRRLTDIPGPEWPWLDEWMWMDGFDTPQDIDTLGANNERLAVHG